MTVSEEKRLEGFSKKGAKTYKLIYSVMNIIGGLAVIGFSVVKILEVQKIIAENIIFKIALLVLVVIMAIVLVIAKNQCKKMSDDE